MEEDEKLTVWHRVDRELDRRKGLRQTPGSWSELGRRVAATKQTINNWKTRGLPKHLYADVAAALGWSVDQLLGLAEAEEPAVSPIVEQHQRLFGALTPLQQEDVHAYAVKMFANITPGVAKKVSEPERGQYVGGLNTNFGGLDDQPADDQKKVGGGKR